MSFFIERKSFAIIKFCYIRSLLVANFFLICFSIVYTIKGVLLMQIQRVGSNNYKTQQTSFKAGRLTRLQKCLGLYRIKPATENVVKRKNFFDMGLQTILMGAVGTPIGMGIGAYVTSLFGVGTASGMIWGMLGGMGLGLFIGAARYAIAASDSKNDFPEPGDSLEIADLFIRAPYAACQEMLEERRQRHEHERKHCSPPKAEPSEYIPDDMHTLFAQRWNREIKEQKEREVASRVWRAHHR